MNSLRGNFSYTGEALYLEFILQAATINLLSTRENHLRPDKVFFFIKY
jgi:hypothetical protein